MTSKQNTKLRLWQESTDEHTLLSTIPNSNRTGEITQHEKSIFQDPISPTKNLSILTRHEKLYYHKSMKQITNEQREIEKSESILKELDQKIQFGHEVSTVRTPSPQVYDDYIRGTSTINSPPLRIVRYDKRGTKYPRVATGHSSTGVSRNVLGGFYNS